MTRRTGRVLAVAVACVAALGLVGCGSRVPPKDFYGASGNAQNGGTTGGSGTTGGTGGFGTTGTTGGSGALSGSGTTGGGTSTGGGSTSGGSTGGSSSGSGTTGGSTGGSRGGSTGSGSGPLSGVEVGTCAGFHNGPGITNSQITIANISDISGPVTGLFRSAQAATSAYVQYFNSVSSICGRKLKLLALDSGTSESGDQQATQTACSSAFAAVGSMGAFDAGGAPAAQQCGIPDLRTASTETARYKSSVSYGTYSLAVPEIPTMPFEYFKTLGNAYKDAAFVYLAAGASSLNAESFIKGETKLGYDFKTTIPIDITSVINYNTYATRLKSEGIKYVQYVGAYQYAQKLKAAFAAQNYDPIFVMDPTAYAADYVAGGSAMNGTYVFIAGPLFNETAKNPELATYLNALKVTNGGDPTFFGTYAWSATALFVRLALQLGGKLSRSTLLAAIRKVNNWTDNGMTPPMYVGGKHSPRCLSIIELQGGKWVRKTPAPYTCGGVVNSGVGG